MTIQQWLIDATSRLVEAGIPSARLDVLILLSDELEQTKAQILAHDDELLSQEQFDNLEMKLQRRAAREPIAYIRGHQEFYGREFTVTPDVLIPRPETETLIELLETLAVESPTTLVDIGTGSGAIAITAKLEHPTWQVIATDVSAEALAVAKTNAAHLEADISLRSGTLLGPLTEPVDIIAANLPYVDLAWERSSPETNYEPALALFADSHGLQLIYDLLDQAPDALTDSGYILLEADPEQHDAIISYARAKSLQHVNTEGYIVGLAR
jgi:release factor glutamine methyltransferase